MYIDLYITSYIHVHIPPGMYIRTQRNNEKTKIKIDRLIEEYRNRMNVCIYIYIHTEYNMYI